MKNRTELLGELNTVLAGLHDGEYCPVGRDVHWFMEQAKSADDIQKAIDILTPLKNANLSEWVKALSQAGLLRCEPTLDSSKKSLIYSYNRIMHYFRGYYFQFSGNKNGHGSYGQSMSRLDRVLFALQMWNDEEDIISEEAYIRMGQYIVAMHALTTMLQGFYKRSMKCLNSTPEIVDEFLANSIKGAFSNGITANSCLSYVTQVEMPQMPIIDPDAYVVANLCDPDDKNGYAVVMASKKEMIVITYPAEFKYVVTAVSIPEELQKLIFEETYYDEFPLAMSVYYSVLEFALSYAEIKANYVCMYNGHRDGQHINISTPNKIFTFEDLTNLVIRTLVKSR